MKGKRHQNAMRIFHYCLILGIAVIPFGKFLAHFFAPAFVVAMYLILTGQGSFPNWKKLVLFALPFFYYLLYFVSWLKEDNHEAGFQIELKMSFILIPLMFLFVEVPPRLIRVFMRFFICSLILTSWICIGNACYYKLNGHQDMFTSSALSVFLHPNYFSLYIVFSVAYLVTQLEKGIAVFKYKKLDIIFILYFLVFNFMLASKIGWFTFILVLVFAMMTGLLKRKKYLFLISGCIALVAASLLSYKYVTVVREKIDNMMASGNSAQVDLSTTESSAVRRLVWKSASEIASRHFWSGVGSGASKDSLLRIYEQRGYTGALAHKLNAHNQFLESMIAFGIWGLVILILLFIVPLVIYNGKFPVLGLWLVLLLIINAGVESMFQSQNGVVFFMIFYCLIFIGRNPDTLRAGLHGYEDLEITNN